MSSIANRSVLRIRARINRLLSEETGQTPEKIPADLNRDYWLSADEAVEYGLIDKVVKSADELD